MLVLCLSATTATLAAMKRPDNGARRPSTWGTAPRFFDPMEAGRRIVQRQPAAEDANKNIRQRTRNIRIEEAAAEPAAQPAPQAIEAKLVPPLQIDGQVPEAAAYAAAEDPDAAQRAEYKQIRQADIQSEADPRSTMWYGKQLYSKLIIPIPADQCAVLTHHTRTRLAFEGDDDKEGVIERRPCPICMENMIGSEDQNLMIFPCGHILHGRCGEQCLAVKRECPTCRQMVTPSAERIIKIQSAQPFEATQNYLQNKINFLVRLQMAGLKITYPDISRTFRRLLLLCYLYHDIVKELLTDAKIEEHLVYASITEALDHYRSLIREEALYWFAHEERPAGQRATEQAILEANPELKRQMERLLFQLRQFGQR